MVYLARFLGLSQFVISFFLLAFGTSLPELVTSLFAALKGDELPLGIVFGSNIANLALIPGILALVGGGFALHHHRITRDVFIASLIAIAPLLMLLDRVLSRLDGLILLGIFLLYLRWLLRHERTPALPPTEANLGRALRAIITFLLALIVVLGSSYLLVAIARQLAADWQLPLLLVGLFLIALSTSLPELITSLTALVRRWQDIVLGNLLGSTVANAAAILGLAALVHPIYLRNFSSLLWVSLFLLCTLLAFGVFARTAHRISRLEGMLLVALYLLYGSVQLILGFGGR
jgi:cation:H+ antiporter